MNVIGVDVAGTQSMLPFLLGALNRLPLLDGDGMGRAFPKRKCARF
jgi:DUF917 family protein